MPWVALALALAWGFLQRTFERVAETAWDDLWAVIFEQVTKAEAEFSTPGTGAKRKEQVLSFVMEWAEKTLALNWLHRMILRYVVSRIVDGLVAELNETMGNDWIQKAQEVKAKLEESWPFLKPGPMEAEA